MSGLRHPPVEVEEAKNTLGVQDKADRSTGRPVAKVAVAAYPHDDWEELDIEAGHHRVPAAAAAGAAPAKPERWTKKRKMIAAASLAGLMLLALALGLGLGLGLKKAPPKRHHTLRPLPGSVAAGAVPNITPAGSTVSHVAVNDAAQLDALMQVKAAIDTGGILKGMWAESTGRDHGYCDWRFVVCDADHRVVEGLNLTTDVYEVVFQGTLPSGAALAGLPGLREIDIRLHVIKGELPEDWAQLTQLEIIRLDQNNLKGPLPASWSRLRNLRMLTLWDNKLTGPIPPAWGALQALDTLDLSYNRLTGRLPPELASLASLRTLLLDVNKLEGLLLEELSGLPGLQQLFLSENGFTGPIPDAWGEMGQLTDLWLDYNKLSGRLPDSLGRLSKLRNLALNDNMFEGAIPASWSDLAALAQFYAYNNPRLTGCVPAALRDQLAGGPGYRLKDYVLHGTKVKGWC